jgi:hypothetical protein
VNPTAGRNTVAFKNSVIAALAGTTVGNQDLENGSIRGRKWDKRSVHLDFLHEAVTSKRLGGATTGSTGDRNQALFCDGMLEWVVLGTQTILTPVLTATGWDVAMDQTNDDGIELTNGILGRLDGPAYKIGTDAAFYAKLKLKLADVSGTDDCAFGFRKAAAYTAAIDSYTDFAVLNVISGTIKIETALNDAATTTTSTTQSWADGETHTLEVYVSATGVVTYKIDGAVPTVTAAFTFDTDDVVVPFFYFLHDSDVCDTVELILWEAGFQANA